MSVCTMVINSRMSNYGDMAVAGIGIALKVTMIISLICVGLGQGIQPLLGYCIGAKNIRRYKEPLRFTLKFALILGIVLELFCYAALSPIVSAFLTEADSFAYAVSFSKVLLTTSFLFGIYYVLTNALQAMGAAKSAFAVNISRQGIIYIPVLLILEAILGINGLAWAQPAADILSTLLVVLLYALSIKSIQEKA